jgi:dipeptidyl aminopeptidase/acylaminoacyl peptidase
MTRTISIPMLALTALVSGSLSHAQAPSGFELALVTADGMKTVLGQLPPSVYAPRVSPDGTRVAFETRDLTGPDGPRLWTADLANIARRTVLPLDAGAINWAPMWTLDGQRLVFIVSGERGGDAVYWRRADGSGAAEHLIDTRAAEGWMAGGAQLRFLTLKESAGNRDYGIAALDMASRQVIPIVDLPNSAQHSSAVSPDGRWMAYASNETGQYEVWIEPLPQTGRRYQLTREGGSHPLWRPDGRALYFDRDHQMFRLAVNVENPASTVEPVALPITGFAQAEYRRQFDLMPNGREFLMLFPVSAPQGRGGAPAAPAITTLAGDVQADWAAQKEGFINAADAMPADAFGYKSTPAQRSYGEQIMHVVQTNMLIMGLLGGNTPAPMVNTKAVTKADVMTALRQSFEFGDAVLKEFNDQQLNARVTPPPFMGPSASRLRLIYGSMQHTFDIYGQMVVYLRLNGIVPPASRRGGL